MTVPDLRCSSFLFFLLLFVWNVGPSDSGSRVSKIPAITFVTFNHWCVFSSPVSRLLHPASQRISPLQSLAITLPKQSGVSVFAATLEDSNCVYGTSVTRCLGFLSVRIDAFMIWFGSGLAP